VESASVVTILSVFLKSAYSHPEVYQCFLHRRKLQTVKFYFLILAINAVELKFRVTSDEKKLHFFFHEAEFYRMSV